MEEETSKRDTSSPYVSYKAPEDLDLGTVLIHDDGPAHTIKLFHLKMSTSQAQLEMTVKEPLSYCDIGIKFSYEGIIWTIIYVEVVKHFRRGSEYAFIAEMENETISR